MFTRIRRVFAMTVPFWLVAVLTLLSTRVTWLRAEQTRARLVAVAVRTRTPRHS